jgi:hypothetical protein
VMVGEGVLEIEIGLIACLYCCTHIAYSYLNNGIRQMV